MLDITRGILASGSVIVNQIARELIEPTPHKKTAERCCRNLKHRNLYDRLQAKIIQSGNKGVFVFGRGFDSRVLREHLVSNINSFIIRGVGKRNNIIDNQELPYNRVCRAMP